MHKTIMVCLVMSLTGLSANNIEKEIGINIGVNSTKNEDGNKFENPTVGVMYQDNKYVISPRVEVEYTQVKDDKAKALLKASVNGVYEYENSTNTTPYALAGIGYEHVSGETKEVFESHPFVQAGAGIKVDLDKGFKARVEGKALQIIGGNDENNEFILTAGMSMPLGIQEVVRTPVPRVVRPVTRVVRPVVIQQPPREPRVSVVHSNNNECPIKISAPDFDRDGVPNSMDQCPATPCSFTVDAYGCPIKTTLKINFASGSSEIRPSSQYQVSRFAEFLLKNKGSRVAITGHTDSRDSDARNLVLSHQRANSVIRALVAQGVSAARLEAFGKGETMPLATNNTAEGRAINRRIEAELFYTKGK